jgi:hypothetical protein
MSPCRYKDLYCLPAPHGHTTGHQSRTATFPLVSNMYPCCGVRTRTISAAIPTQSTGTLALDPLSTSWGECFKTQQYLIKRLTNRCSFNEPDLGAQANLSPAAAASAWKTYIQPYAGRVKLVSPAVTNGAAPMGLTWLDNFFSACSGCTIDAVAIHIYDSATNIDYFKNYITGGVSFALNLR